MKPNGTGENLPEPLADSERGTILLRAGATETPCGEEEPAGEGLTMNDSQPPMKPPQDPIIIQGTEAHVAAEAIVVVQVFQADTKSDRFGWRNVGRRLYQRLRKEFSIQGIKYGLSCMKGTVDGLLLTYRSPNSAEVAAVYAIEAAFELQKWLQDHNQNVAEEHQFQIKISIHFGEVDLLPGDREGPNIRFSLKIASITRSSLVGSLSQTYLDQFPLFSYIICSEQVYEIVSRRCQGWIFKKCGLFKLAGISAWWELFWVSLAIDPNAI